MTEHKHRFRLRDVFKYVYIFECRLCKDTFVRDKFAMRVSILTRSCE